MALCADRERKILFMIPSSSPDVLNNQGVRSVMTQGKEI